MPVNGWPGLSGGKAVSAHEPPKQFTPAQVLEAGRRAEAEGRAEYAVQFYRHLVDHYPGSSQAAAALAGLSRVGLGSNGGLNGRLAQASNMAAGTTAGSDPVTGPPSGPPSLPNPFGTPRPPDPGFGQWQSEPSQPVSAPQRRQSEPELELPRLRRDYRTGRVLARLCAWLGGLLVVAGLVLIPVSILNPRLIASLPMIGNSLAGPIAGLTMIITGIVQVMLGQLVRAVLDHANSARDIAAITRAKAEARHGQPGRRSRRR